MKQRHILLDGTKAVPLETLQSWEQMGNVPWGDGGDSNVTEVYDNVAFIYRCVEVRANSIMNMPWAIHRNETPVWSSEDATPPREFLPYEDLPTWLWQIEAALCTVASAYLLKMRNRIAVTGARWLDPFTMQPKWSARDGLIEFERRLANSIITIPVEDVVYITLPGHSETEPRTSPVRAALHAGNVLLNVDQFAEKYFKRGAIKATILTLDGNPAPAEKERIKSWWGSFFSGVASAWSSAVVSGKIIPVVVGEGIQDLGNATLTSEKREDIATAMGVPHSMVLSNAANFATANADRLNFYDTTIVPEGDIIARALNRQLFGPMGYRFTFDAQAMAIYQEDEEQRSGSLVNLRNAGIPLETALAILGYDVPENMPLLEPPQVQVLPPTNNGAIPMIDTAQRGYTAEQKLERAKLLRWAKGKKEPDAAKFVSSLLTLEQRQSILAQEGGAAVDAPFPLVWEGYP